MPNRRDFLAASLGAAFSPQLRSAPVRKAKTTKLFKCPSGFPNALASTPEGLWVGEQKLSGEMAKAYSLPEPGDLTENAWLMNLKGEVLRTVKTPSRNTSGMAAGGGYIWMVANQPPQGVFQVDMNSKLVSHRQIPLGPKDSGGGCHGAQWHNGKLWIAALRLRGNIRVDPLTFQPDFMIPFYQAPERNRYHDITVEGESMWQVVGNDCGSHQEYRPALVRYELATGKVQEVVDFLPGSCDPHGLALHNGKLISCDAGIHPKWPNRDSPSAGWIFQIDFV